MSRAAIILKCKFSLSIAFIAVVALSSCGKAISTAQDFFPNKAPSISSFTAVNTDGSEINAAKISPKSVYVLSVSAADPENQKLTYTFSSQYGTFKNQAMTDTGCTVQFVVGAISGSEEVKVSVAVSDPRGAVIGESKDLGTGKIGPSITILPDTVNIQSTGKVNLSITSNCSGIFQIRTDISDAPTSILQSGDVMNYKAGTEKISVVLAGPKCSSTANARLPVNGDSSYLYNDSDTVWVVFRDSLNQIDAVKCVIIVDDVAPVISSNTATSNSGSVSTDPAVDITFNEDMDAASFLSASLTLTPSVSGASAGSASYKADSYNSTTRTATFLMTGLSRNMSYTATLAGVKDLAGNTISSSANSFSFTTTPTCSVTYNGNGANGGTVPVGAVNYLNGVTVTVLGNTGSLEKTGCDFAGWNTQPDGSGIAYSAGSSFTIGTESVTLYAVWKGVELSVNGITLTQNTIEITVNMFASLVYDSVDVNAYQSDNNAVFVDSGSISKSGTTITIAGLTVNTEYTVVLTAKKDGNTTKTITLYLTPSASTATVTPLYTADDLKSNVTTANISSSFILMNDIDLGGAAWTPVGGSSSLYSGTFNGNGKTISHFNITATSAAQGFFGYVSGTVTRLSLDITDCTISSTASKFGAVAGENSGTISKCSVVGGTVSGSDSVGGLVGYDDATGTITDCYATCAVSAAGSSTGVKAGGLVGYLEGTISNCYATGSVTSSYLGASGYIGGLVGLINGTASITNSHATGDVAGQASGVGGLVGRINGSSATSLSTITNCYATGSVTNTKTMAGGLIGYTQYTTISNCYAAKGAVTGSSAYVGGLVGYTDYTTISNCYATTGTVTGSSSVGGLVGSNNNSSISYSYAATGKVSSNISYTSIGGIVGSKSGGVITDCYYDATTTTMTDTANGTGLSTTAMISAIQNDTNWSASVWGTSGISTINNGYPYLISNVP